MKSLPHRALRLTSLAALAISLCLAAPAYARPTATLTVDTSAESVRLILTHSESISYALQSSRNRIRIRYAEPISLNPPEATFDNPIFERYRLRDESTLVLYLGPEFGRHDKFELRNPFRLIFDLQAAKRTGRRGRRGEDRSQIRSRYERIIVVDPGHGGIEHGAVGPTGLEEKQVALLLGRELKRALEQRDPNITVVLTRDEDRHLGLDERTAVANHNKADLFLSIHLNASPRASATGAETYYLSTEPTDKEARVLAALENQAEGGRGSARPTENLDLVLWDLAQNQHLAASSALAQAMQRQLNRAAGIRDRGVRQAPFRVLMGAMMPAILVEVGFISNPQEEARFRTPGYRARTVDAMVSAVQEFLLDLERIDDPDRGAGGR